MTGAVTGGVVTGEVTRAMTGAVNDVVTKAVTDAVTGPVTDVTASGGSALSFGVAGCGGRSPLLSRPSSPCLPGQMTWVVLPPH